MRASFVVLAVATVLAACDAVAATANSVKVVETSHKELLDKSKRALRVRGSTRGAETTWADSEDADETDANDDEERGSGIAKVIGLKKASEKAPVLEKALKKVASLEKAPVPPTNLFLYDDINRMTRDWDFKIDRWKEWYTKYTVGDIRKELDKFNLKEHPKFKKLLVDYINTFKSRVDKLGASTVKKKAAEEAGKKVHFGTNSETTIEKIDAVMAENAEKMAAMMKEKLLAEKLLKKQAKKKWSWS